MKKFIAYFDFLGFKEFIYNNHHTYYHRIIGNVYRDIEDALRVGSDGHLKDGEHGWVISDISGSRINALNFSDTILFWSNDDSIESLNEILRVCHSFNLRQVVFVFPVRGALVHGEIFHNEFKQTNKGGVYTINSPYGKGVIAAHLKAESQNWAGSVLDQSVVDHITNNGWNLSQLVDQYCTPYLIPYKEETVNQKNELAFRLVTGELNQTAYGSQKDSILRNFSNHNKPINHPKVQEKLENTLRYLQSFIK